MESQLTQANTFAAQSYAESFFRELPTDSRFLQTSFQKFPPNSSIESKVIEFSLNRFTAANVYQIQNTHLEVQISIVKASDGKVPDTAKEVGPVNNILHSLFESVSLKINDQPITKSAGNYPYKAFISNILTYPGFVKAAQLTAEGFYLDAAPHMNAVENNSGWKERVVLFRKLNQETAAYKEEGCRFFGKLQLDLMSCPTGLIPGTKVDIELVRSSDDFFILKEAEDTENYKVKLLNCFLYVPVAQLSSLTFSEIERVLVAKSVAIHYRKIEIRQISLVSGKEEFNSENLFPSDLPCRVVICFVESKNKTGGQALNPFNFQRRWEVTVNEEHFAGGLTPREVALEQELLEIKRQFAEIQSSIAPHIETTGHTKGKGRGKRSTPQTSASGSLFVRLRNSFSGPSRRPSSTGSTPSIHSQPSTSSEAPPPYSPRPAALGATKKVVYIKQVDLLLNGAPLDQICLQKH